MYAFLEEPVPNETINISFPLGLPSALRSSAYAHKEGLLAKIPPSIKA